MSWRTAFQWKSDLFTSLKREELKTIMAGWDPMLLKLLDVATDVRFWTLLQLPEENRVWTDSESGGTILIGDAAHSMTPYM
jgi:salicylate hydroxylase